MAAAKHDMEELLKHKPFAELTAEERDFVLTQVGDEEEYERIRRMMPLMSEGREPELTAPAGFREALLQEAAQQKKEEKTIPIAWYRKRWVIWTATSIAASLLFAIVWFFSGNNADVISTDPIVKVEEQVEEAPEPSTGDVSPAFAENTDQTSETKSEEPHVIIAEEIAENTAEPDDNLAVDKSVVPTIAEYDLSPQPGMNKSYTWNSSSGSTTSANVILADTVVANYFVGEDLTGTVARTGNAMSVPAVKSTEKGKVSSQEISSNTRIMEESSGAEIESLDAVAVVSSKGRKVRKTSKSKRASSKMGETRIPVTSHKLSGQLDLLPLLITTRDN